MAKRWLEFCRATEPHAARWEHEAKHSTGCRNTHQLVCAQSDEASTCRRNTHRTFEKLVHAPSCHVHATAQLTWPSGGQKPSLLYLYVSALHHLSFPTESRPALPRILPISGGRPSKPLNNTNMVCWPGQAMTGPHNLGFTTYGLPAQRAETFGERGQLQGSQISRKTVRHRQFTPVPDVALHAVLSISFQSRPLAT